jgi:hypothetical protein
MRTRTAALNLMVAALGVLNDRAPAGPRAPILGSPVDYILGQRMGMKAEKPTKEGQERAARLIEQERAAAVALYRKARLSGRKQVRPELGWLRDRLVGEIDQLTARLEASEITAAIWQADFERLLARYHAASLMAGQGSPDLEARSAEYLARLVGEQFEYLANFRMEIVDAAEWQAGFATRAESYASAIQVPYWTGDVQFLPLPAMPGEGTTCLGNCRCSWRIDTLDQENGDYDCYWELGQVETHHCQICLERADGWNPIQIRNGELQV